MGAQCGCLNWLIAYYQGSDYCDTRYGGSVKSPVCSFSDAGSGRGASEKCRHSSDGHCGWIHAGCARGGNGQCACADGTPGAAELAMAGVVVTPVGQVQAWAPGTLVETCAAAGCMRDGDDCICEDISATPVGLSSSGYVGVC